MKKLIITANPSSKGFIHKIAKTMQLLSEEKGCEVDILDLYKTELRQGFLSFEDIRDMGQDEITKKIQEKISWADELVFIFPIWWGDMPAIMKNFFDSNFSSGYAFKYVNGKPIGLLEGKTARIIATSGGPSFFYKIILHIQFLWKVNRIGFCGIKQESFTVFGNIDRKSTDKEKYLKMLNRLV